MTPQHNMLSTIARKDQELTRIMMHQTYTKTYQPH